MHIRVVFLFLVFIYSGTAMAQSSAKQLKTDAERYYTNAKYPEALNLFLKYQRLKSAGNDTRLKIGHCYLMTNEVDESLRYFDGLIAKDKKVPQLAYYYRARALHVKHQFKEAADAYKVFLSKTTKKGHRFRDASKDALLRCVNGFNLPDLSRKVIVENLGELVNDRGDDFAPVLSPNHDDRIYYSSARADNVGGARLANGAKDEVYGKPKSDMFTASIIAGGQWGGATALNPLLNSAKHDMILGFNENGSVLYYFNGIDLTSGETFVDTFGTETATQRPHFYGPAIAETGDIDLQFFNDTIVLFSSDRSGGYGGKDIYVSTFENGFWSKPANLGPTINSAYDEVTPFLSADGRTLYFSSNNLKSLGNLDIFKSKFLDNSKSWSQPENLGIPFNSAREDAYFKLSENGMKAFFSSARTESIGERDLYVCYFSAAGGEQRRSNPIVFTEVLYNKNKVSTIADISSGLNNGTGEVSIDYNGTPQEVEEYTFPVLPFDQSGAILTKENKTVLKDVIVLLKKYPSLKLELVSHSDPTGPAKFDLYFSAKRAEEVSDYLIDNGCNPQSIHIRGCGSNYPIAKNQTEGGTSDLGSKLNRRINMVFHRTAGKPIVIKQKYPTVPAFVRSEDWDDYNATVQGLSYKIQIADIKQMYNGDLLTKLPHATIETNGDSDSYQYTVGLFRNFSSARALQVELVRQNIPGAFVAPYVDGLRVSISDARIFAKAYPDLYNYLRSVEE
ncbi:MAG: OmpA family protein [Saprospiraceae bacterium]